MGIRFRKKPILTGHEKNDEVYKPMTAKEWAIMIIAAVIILCVIRDCNGQTITRNYDGTHRIRIDGSTTQLKPCFVFYCGGGFVTQNWSICNAWELMAVDSGYVSCRVGYSTSLLYPTKEIAEKGINDCMNAVKWIKLHAAIYHIDTNRIYLMGTSAGGFCAMGAYEYKVKVKGIVNGWGGILDQSYLGNMSIPVFNISTDADKIVPLDCGYAFGVFCCGSRYIFNTLKAMGKPTDWMVFEGRRHGLLPKDAGYNEAVNDCFIQSLKFFKQ
jgi:hypothetical protein